MNRHANPSSRCSRRNRLEHPRLDGDVERAGGLVGDQQLRAQRQGAGDGDALPLPAGQLVRVARGVRRASSHRLQQLGDPRADPRRGPSRCSRSGSAIACADRCSRVQGGGRVLEDDADLAQQLGRRPGATRRPRSMSPTRTVPAVGCTRPASTRPRVDLPEPDSPTRPSVRPRLQRDVDAADGVHRRAGAAAGPVAPYVTARPRRGRRRARPAVSARLTGARPRPPPGSSTSERSAAAGTAASSVAGVALPRRRRRRSSTGRARRSRPSRITTTSSARSATTPMSWVISSIASAALGRQPAQQVEDAGLHGDVQRGGRLVGDQQLRVAADRHRDHRPLQLAAGELVRVRRGDPRRVVEPDRGEQLEHALGAARPTGRPAVRLRAASAIWLPIVSTGFQALIGSWKTMPTTAAADRAQRRRASAEQVGRRRSSDARRPTRRRGRSRPSTDIAVTVLPDPDSPTSASTRPRRTSRSIPCTTAAARAARRRTRRSARRRAAGAIGHQVTPAPARPRGSSGRPGRPAT